MANKTAKGKFQPGKSGNPGGRPKVPTEIRELARSHMEAAINTAAEIMKDRAQRAGDRLSACHFLADRGYGKPAQAIDLTQHKSPLDDLDAATLAALADALESGTDDASR